MLRNDKDSFVYNLPYIERHNLCKILDVSNKWEELGCMYMKYDSFTVQGLRNEILRGRSPTDALLTMWGHQNHTVLELFVLLSHMKLYDAMYVIKDFVDEKYHYLFKYDDRKDSHKEKEEKVMNCEPKQLSVSREENNKLKTETNEDVKNNKKSPFDTQNLGDIPQISYEELELATDNWNPKNILGKGGFGTVFKGTWKRTQVAIKRIEKRENEREGYKEELRQSFTELRCLYTYRHDNILSVYACSLMGKHHCLIYQYMSGGCLDKRLRIKDVTKVLPWDLRLNIAIGAARGLQFLHTIGPKPLIHCDIKPANILLDTNNQPKIGDFGLAREGPLTDYVQITRIQGTRPYLPEEFLRGKKLSTKVDTYSFGVVLFEIGTALAAYSSKRPNDNQFLRDYIINYESNLLELKDKRMNGGEDIYKAIMEIGKECVEERPKNRPEMVTVLTKLENITTTISTTK